MFLLSQRDPRWAKIRMGESNLQLGGWGCTTTCLSIVSHYAGQYISPAQFAVQDENYTDKNHSLGPGLVLWHEFAKDLKNVNYFRRIREHDAKLFKEAIKDRSKMVILQVKTITASYPFHWVVATKALKGGDYEILDPWYGTKTTVKEHYSHVVGAAIAEAVDGYEFTDQPDETPKQEMPVVGLIKAKTSPKVYYYTGRSRHWIPNWDTRMSPLFQTMPIQELTDAIVAGIPEGEAFPKMH